MAIKVTSLTEQEISEIGEAFAYYNYAEGEYGMSALYKSKEDVKKYICGYARAMLKAGFLYSTSEEHEAFIAFKSSKESLGFGAVSELIKAVIRTMRFRDMIKLVKLAKKGGESYEDSLKKAKKPYVFVGMLVVRQKYQGQGYMRKVLDIAYEEGKKLGCPVLLDTDAALKRDKYVHLGMKNVRTRKFDEGIVLYELAKED